MNNYLNQLQTWLGLGGFGLAAGMGALWFFGLLGPVARIVASVVEIATPILRAGVEFIIEYIRWLWNGFVDVIDNYMTIVFVATLMVITYFVALEPKKTFDLRQCKGQVIKLEKQLKQCPIPKKPTTTKYRTR